MQDPPSGYPLPQCAGGQGSNVYLHQPGCAKALSWALAGEQVNGAPRSGQNPNSLEFPEKEPTH